MASPIWNEKEKRWTLRVTTNGKTKKFTSNKSGLAGKKAVLKKARDYTVNGIEMADKMTVNDCWVKFMSMNEARLGAQSGQYKQYADLGRLHILPVIGSKKIQNLTKADYQGILDNAKPLDGKRDVLSKKYLTNIRATLVKFVKFCHEYEYCDGIRGELYIPQGHPTIGKEILQPNDIKKLFEPSDNWYHNYYKFLLCTGCRVGEGYGLKWSDIKDDCIEINRAVNDRGQITAGKNANARRTLPMTTIIKEILEAQKEATESLKSEWVFCNMIGAMSTPHTAAKHWVRFREERDLNCTLYGLRHTFVSMVKNTMPEQLVKTVVGHSSSMRTFEVYGNHKVDGELKQAAEIMDLTFGKLAK